MEQWHNSCVGARISSADNAPDCVLGWRMFTSAFWMRLLGNLQSTWPRTGCADFDAWRMRKRLLCDVMLRRQNWVERMERKLRQPKNWLDVFFYHQPCWSPWQQCFTLHASWPISSIWPCFIWKLNSSTLRQKHQSRTPSHDSVSKRLVVNAHFNEVLPTALIWWIPLSETLKTGSIESLPVSCRNGSSALEGIELPAHVGV